MENNRDGTSFGRGNIGARRGSLCSFSNWKVFGKRRLAGEEGIVGGVVRVQRVSLAWIVMLMGAGRLHQGAAWHGERAFLTGLLDCKSLGLVSSVISSRDTLHSTVDRWSTTVFVRRSAQPLTST